MLKHRCGRALFRMNLLILSGYNNYFNRQVKFYEELAGYYNNTNYELKTEINFNPGDGVTTTLILNWDNNYQPDYIVVFNEYDEVISRWFIMDYVRTRNGQYQASLKRDLVADFYKEVREQPVFVQRGNVLTGNPFIYNSEGMVFNQIKSKETLLKDETGTAWIVGYLDKNAIEGDVSFMGTSDSSGATTLESLPIYLNDGNPLGGGYVDLCNSITYRASVRRQLNTRTHAIDTMTDGNLNLVSYNNKELNINAPYFAIADSGQLFAIEYPGIIWITELEKNNEARLNATLNYLEENNLNHVNSVELQNIRNLNGTVVYSTRTQKYYTISVSSSSSGQEIKKTINSSNVQLYSVLNNSSKKLIEKSNGKWKEAAFPEYELILNYSRYSITFTETVGDGTPNILFMDTHFHTTDAPYDIFCMPFNETNFNLINEMIIGFGTKLYDVQILPYCPARFAIIDGQIDLDNLSEDEDYHYVYIGEEGDIFSYLLWCRTSSDSFVIKHSISTADNPVELKIQNECDFYRLCSPNYNGSFEFNAAKNDGVSYFTVYFTYKPFSPYIQVAPNFGGLYGTSYGDARGLICNGDFSIATMSDAWTQYEINNKNYQNIFNTEIKTMDAQQDIVNAQMSWSAALGSIQGSVSGMSAGAMAGGGWGAAIGGVLGGVSSLGAGHLDKMYNERSYQINRQAKEQLFNYNLQNIRALPNTLNKISAYTINNKYFPFIEYYTCTEQEKNALRQKLKYEGMTIGSIGYIADYEDIIPEFNYFKGQLIQVGALEKDYHIADALSVELEKGIYLPGGKE